MKNQIIFLIGVVLFVLVLIGISIMIYVESAKLIPLEYEFVAPIIVFTGFFVFIIAAILVGWSSIRMLSHD